MFVKFSQIVFWLAILFYSATLAQARQPHTVRGTYGGGYSRSAGIGIGGSNGFAPPPAWHSAMMNKYFQDNYGVSTYQFQGGGANWQAQSYGNSGPIVIINPYVKQK